MIKVNLRWSLIHWRLFLNRFHDAWQLCEELKQPHAWLELGKSALQSLDIDFGMAHMLIHFLASFDFRPAALYVLE
jgi:hypothetical protein